MQESFYPMVGSLVEGDRIFLREDLGIALPKDINFGDIAIIHTVVKTGNAVILSMEVNSSFLAATLPSDTLVELVPPF